MFTPRNATWFNKVCLPEVDRSHYVVFFHGNKLFQDTKYTTVEITRSKIIILLLDV